MRMEKNSAALSAHFDSRKMTDGEILLIDLAHRHLDESWAQRERSPF